MDEAEARKRYINEPVVPYSLSNPHPLYGKDPNIMNEFGHTHYPKWVYPNGTNNDAVLANDAKHEKELMSDLEAAQQKLVFDPPKHPPPINKKVSKNTWDE